MVRLPGAQLRTRIAVEAHALATCYQSGMIGTVALPKVPTMLRAVAAFGPLGAGITLAALRHGDRVGLVDELGELSFNELDARSNALVNAWRSRGIGPGAGIGILARNHRGFLDATFACAKLGARAMYLNTDFSAPQAVDVCRREGVEVLVYDEEFEKVVAGVEAAKGRFLAWADTDPGERGTLEALIAEGDRALPPSPGRPSSVVLLTSGTTGLPKGAPRQQPKSLAIPAALLSKIPFRGGEGMYVAPPFFHAWGFVTMGLAVGVGATLITRRRFDPQATLDGLEKYRCGSLVTIPVMLKRLLNLGEDEICTRDLSKLRVIACAGAQLDGPLATRTLNVFGDVLHVTYGSTECGDATIAEPADLRAAPTTVGKPPYGITIKIVDDTGNPVPTGQTGRIFVGNTMQFSGYTGGGMKEMLDGMMSSGDVGHFDAEGRLFIDGRDDDMIVSGGENVFPQEVEELLAAHAGINDAAVIGVDDEEFGKALRAFVVRRPNAELDEAGVRAYVKENLARYKVPRSVVFVDELPRNPSGKVLKRVLREWAPPAEQASPASPASS
jgi:fatty-acyl-CoA synthase